MKYEDNIYALIDDVAFAAYNKDDCMLRGKSSILFEKIESLLKDKKRLDFLLSENGALIFKYFERYQSAGGRNRGIDQHILIRDDIDRVMNELL